MWWSFLLRGLFALALAACALFWPQRTIAILTKILGAYFLFDGATGAFSAYRSGDRGSALVPAIVSLAAGLVLLFWTAISAKVFLVIIGIWAILQAIGLLASSWQMDSDDENRLFVALVGIALLITGVVFIVWPDTGVVAVSWLIAIGAAIVGALLIYLATRFKRFGKRVANIGAEK